MGARSSPVLCVVHDANEIRELLARDLAERFGAQYELASHSDAGGALAALRRHAAEGRAVAAVFSADTDACGGERFWSDAHDLHPAARRVLLVGRGEWNKAHPAVAAMRAGRADSYVFVPWGPRERWLYLPVTETLADWEAAVRPLAEVVQIVGEEWESRAHALRDLFARLGLPMGFYAPGSERGREILAQAPGEGDRLPVVAFRTGSVYVDPSFEQIATALGFSTVPERDRCDVAIVGAGPAGLAAAVYAASEGLATTVIDEGLPGGQAGTSSRIRNYLGFPTGLSGRDLTNRALEQAWFFGARLVLSKRVCAIVPAADGHVIELTGAPPIAASTVIVASGVAWRRLDVPPLERLQGAGVFYGAAAADASAAEGLRVFIVGAGNSAGQGAVHLARAAAEVTLLVRGDRLAASMSDYLVRQLDELPNVRIRLRTEVVGASGSTRLTGLTLRDPGGTEEVAAEALYVMIGAEPHTDWLDGTLARDDQGYLLTGDEVLAQTAHPWPLERPPMLLETSLPGVFAAGDVRRSSVKRVASAVGDGSIAVRFAHLRLAELSGTA